MKRYLFIAIILSSLVFCFTSSVSAKEEIKIFPQEVYPGDVFVVIVNTDKKYKSIWIEFQERRIYLSKCDERCFSGIVPVDLTIESGIYSVKIKLGEIELIREINVRSKQSGIKVLTLPKEKVFLSKKDLKRVKRENNLIKKIFKRKTKKKWIGDFIYPLENEITADFGIKRILNGNYESIHKGIDIKGDKDEDVVASNRGRVVLIKELFFGGKTVIIDHGDGIFTFYMHLSKTLVKKNSVVSKGDVIGYVGSTGRSTGLHLHFGVKVDGVNVNPVSVVSLEM